jgi:hypothetical protein
MKLKETLNGLGEFGKKNSPAILTGLAIVGLVSTAVAAYKAAPEAEKILKQKKEDLKKVDPEDKAAKRTVVIEAAKELTPVMLPTIIMGGATAACIIGSNSISSKRIAVLSTAYTVSEKAVKDLNGKMQEMLGEKKTRAIKDAIVKDKVGETPKDGNSVIITGNGDVLCKDLYSGRFFQSNAQKLGQAINKLSHDVQTDMYVSLNDLYDEIGLPRIPMGDDFGWNVDDAPRGQLPIDLTAVLTDDGTPCLCLNYDSSLRDDFRRLY